MTFQEILEGITRHRGQILQVNQPSNAVITSDLVRKLDEIEWALQALAETLRDREAELKALLPPPQGTLDVDEAFEEYARGTS